MFKIGFIKGGLGVVGEKSFDVYIDVLKRIFVRD